MLSFSSHDSNKLLIDSSTAPGHLTLCIMSSCTVFNGMLLPQSKEFSRYDETKEPGQNIK